MAAKDAYRTTLFDRHGADAHAVVAAAGWALFVFGVSLLTFALQLGHLTVAIVAGSAAAALLVWVFTVGLARGAGRTWRGLMVNGASTPYVEQFSYQQALVMQGRVDDALDSFESILAADPLAVDARLRAAELYDREKKNPARAAALFRDVQRIESVGAGPFVYATNRLADLYAGPLNEPGKALVELRRLIERHPTAPAAAHARDALARLKRALPASTAS